ncbi:hypothetical protein PTMSG1_01456 [Pyrenophora teres f. maculata]|nr:hypothetical protein PTMSG1_01456 [Pyrenophora teres f. maculata]
MLVQSPLLLALFASTVVGQKYGWLVGTCTPEQTDKCNRMGRGCAIYGEQNGQNSIHICNHSPRCDCPHPAHHQGVSLDPNPYHYTCGCISQNVHSM